MFQIEFLEGRRLLSGTPLTKPLDPPTALAQFEINNHILYLTGTHRDDQLHVTRVIGIPSGLTSRNMVSLDLLAGDPNAKMQAVAGTTPLKEVFVITTLHDTYYADTDGVTKIIMNGGAGKDSIGSDRLVAVTTDIRGGDGNDTLSAGRTSNILRGGAGDDKLTGVGGPAGHFQGGEGYDTLALPGPRKLGHNLFLDIEVLTDPGNIIRG